MQTFDSRLPEIIVAGTGPAGLVAALAFGQAGFAVALVGPRPTFADGRTTAIMQPGLVMLDRLGVLAAVEPDTAPLRSMRIVDVTNRLVRAPVVTFHASEIGEEQFGLNVPNRALNQALWAKVEGIGEITHHEGQVTHWTPRADDITAVLDTGATVTAKLAVGADGRNSLAREAAGIRSTSTRHQQSALVLTFAHTRPHGSISTELHTEHGPCTQVPLPGDRSSLVWVGKPAEVERMSTLDREALSRAVEERMNSMLGKVTVDSDPQVYPLTSALPSAFARDRIALVGEAAHAFPPIGAQGLNLGIRDVEQLVEIAERYREDPALLEALAAYDRTRRPDVLARSGAVGLLNLSLLSGMLPVQVARSAGLNLLRSFAPLRSLLMREGLRPGSGVRALVSPRRKEKEIVR